jgi:hypothetical protein
VSAPAELVITVTDDDIASGVRKDGAKCPIAVAICRLYPGVRDPFVGGDLTRQIGIYWDEEAWPVIYAMPDEAVDFTLCFDHVHSGTVAPFTFTALVIP